MKNNYKYLFFVVFIFFLKINNAYTNDFNFEASEIEILNDGNKLKAINGVTITSNDGIKINANEFEYDKIKKILLAKDNIEVLTNNGLKINSDKFEYDKIRQILTAKGEVQIIDSINNIKVNAEQVIYYKNKDIVLTKGKTNGIIEKIYIFKTKNITLDRKNLNIISKYKTIINDNENNIFELNKFKYSAKDKLFKAKKIKYINNLKDEFFFENALIKVDSNEIIGKDIVINFHNSIFNSPENQPRLKGNTFYYNPNKTNISKGVFTTCKKRDGCPPWVISAQSIEHDKLKKTINYKNAWLKVYDMPVLYFPKFFHPDPTVKRQSGFLIPKFSDSTHLGSSLNIPYFHVISENKDFTVSPRLYADKKIILQSEFRAITKNTKNIFDFSLLKGHDISVNDDGDTRSHFFSNSIFNLNLDTFNESKIELNLQNTSNDNYLKLYNLKSKTVKNVSTLNSYLNFDASRDDLSIKTSVEVYEDLNKTDSNRYEYIYPNFTVLKKFNRNEKINGNFSLESNGYQKEYDTNSKETVVINNLLYKSDPLITSKGFKNNYSVILKNTNTDTKNSSQYKTDADSQLLGMLLMESAYPLKKETANYNNLFTPKISFRYSPTQTRNIKDSDRRIDINNVFSLDRLGSNDTLEGGQSLTIGTEYKKNRKNNEELLSLNLAKVYRDKQNLDIPTKSTIGNKSSDLVGNFTISPNQNFNLDYNFSFDNNLDTSNYNLIKTEFKTNNFVTSFEYLEENNLIGDESYIGNTTSYSFDNKTSLSFATKKNKKTNLTEFYNLIYQYHNDCLTAAVEYNKHYYEDDELRPEEQIFFSLTILPFAKASSPNLRQ